MILASLELHDLVSVLRVNRTLHSISLRTLYRALPRDLSPIQSVKCLQTISKNDLVAGLVRSLHIDWAALFRPSLGLFRLLHTALRRLSKLTVLSLELRVFANFELPITWIFQGCSFSLNVFISSIRCDQSLADFLHSQSKIVELGLRGFGGTGAFTLRPSSLPHLQSLRVVHADTSVLESVVRGRPIENVTLTVAPGDGFKVLRALKLSTKEVLRLSILTLEFATPEEVLTEVGACMPGLLALQILIVNSTQVTASRSFFSFLSVFDQDHSHTLFFFSRSLPGGGLSCSRRSKVWSISRLWIHAYASTFRIRFRWFRIGTSTVLRLGPLYYPEIECW